MILHQHQISDWKRPNSAIFGHFVIHSAMGVACIRSNQNYILWSMWISFQKSETMIIWSSWKLDCCKLIPVYKVYKAKAKTRFIRLVVTRQQARYYWCIYRQKCDKQGTTDVFRGENAESNTRLRYLKAIRHGYCV